jgi:succinyl-CoA synthetase alpha subunit
VVYISGKSFPMSKKMPFVGVSSLTPAQKILQKQQVLEAVGAKVVYSPELIGKTVWDIMNKG